MIFPQPHTNDEYFDDLYDPYGSDIGFWQGLLINEQDKETYEELLRLELLNDAKGG